MVLLLHGSYGIIRGGWIGVDLFFVLSGFLITSLLLEEFSNTNTISLSKFYARRALRLFPPLIVCVILANILWSHTTFGPIANRTEATFAALFYYANLLADKVNGNMSPLWSLSVEEHFYFLWPILTSVFIFKMPVRNRILLISLLIFAVWIFRIFIYNNESHLVYGIFKIDSYYFTFCRFDSILSGALLTFVFTTPGIESQISDAQGKYAFLIIPCIISFAAILYFVDLQNAVWNNGGFIFTNLLCALTVAFAIMNPNHHLLSNKILGWIGKRSYGIYLYHYPIFLALERYRHAHNTGNLILITLLRFGMPIVLAAISYKYIEQPILKYKKNFQPKVI